MVASTMAAATAAPVQCSTTSSAGAGQTRSQPPPSPAALRAKRPSLSPSARQELRWTPRRRSSCGSPAPARSLPRDSPFREIDSRDLEADAPGLLGHCSDLDWRTLADDLRAEALRGLQSGSSGSSSLNLGALEQLMGSWIHQRVANGIERSAGAANIVPVDPEWSVDAAARDLRMAANMQATQELAKGVDSTFDWEAEAAELHRRILQQGGAEQSEERSLWQAWTRACGQVDESSNQLAEEALASNPVSWTAEASRSKSRLVEARSELSSDLNEQPRGKTLLVTLGAMLAADMAWGGLGPMIATADDLSTEAVKAAGRAPSWLVPAVLVFPPLSYFLFNVYRDKVNPYAKLSDWMFGVVAIVIVSNIVMMAVWGVRLY